MPPDEPITRLTPDEVGEVLRRHNVVGARFEGRPTIEELAEKVGLSVDEVRRTVATLRSLGAAIDAPSGDLEAIRVQAQDLEVVEEDPRAQARVAADEGYIQMEGGAGKLPRSTRLILITAIVIFVGLVLLYATKSPPPR